MLSAYKMESIKVGMSEYKVVAHPAILTCIGLGSCIGIALYDEFKKVGGLAHIMLPIASEARDASNPAKFADQSISLMVAQMENQGCLLRNIKAKIFGGANMFPSVKSTAHMNVGARNEAAVKEELSKRKLKIVAQDLGGDCGRTIIFDLQDGSVRVKTAFGEEKIY